MKYYRHIVLMVDGSAKDSHLGGASQKTTGGYIAMAKSTKEEIGRSVSFGKGTSQEAEYRALIAGLYGVMHTYNRWPTREISVMAKSDCLVIVKQIKGQVRVKNPNLKALRDKVMRLSKQFGEFRIQYLPRSENIAHALT